MMKPKQNSEETIHLKLGDELAGTKPITIHLSVRASDGSFDAQLSFPVTATREEIDRVVQGWLKMMEGVINMCRQ